MTFRTSLARGMRKTLFARWSMPDALYSRLTMAEWAELIYEADAAFGRALLRRWWRMHGPNDRAGIMAYTLRRDMTVEEIEHLLTSMHYGQHRMFETKTDPNPNLSIAFGAAIWAHQQYYNKLAEVVRQATNADLVYTTAVGNLTMEWQVIYRGKSASAVASFLKYSGESDILEQEHNDECRYYLQWLEEM